jgi:NAD(P)-dependent dehydrogenase (short-subunit alcohol dehydrogenase family)
MALATFLSRMEQPLEGAILCVGANPMYTEGPRHIHSLSAPTIEATIRTNCTHTFLLTTAILQRLRRQGGGVLIWIGSLAQKIGLPGAGLYCATKAFLTGLARTARHEYAGRGVRVHLVHPALVRTPRTSAVIDRFAVAHGLKVAEASEVAREIVDRFLAGEPADLEVEL